MTLLHPTSNGKQMPHQMQAPKARKETFPERTSPALPLLQSVVLLRGGLIHPVQGHAPAKGTDEEQTGVQQQVSSY